MYAEKVSEQITAVVVNSSDTFYLLSGLRAQQQLLHGF